MLMLLVYRMKWNIRTTRRRSDVDDLAVWSARVLAARALIFGSRWHPSRFKVCDGVGLEYTHKHTHLVTKNVCCTHASEAAAAAAMRLLWLCDYENETTATTTTLINDASGR